jgi:cyclophilin family peptidyl-prolyl cis-trans isomerase
MSGSQFYIVQGQNGAHHLDYNEAQYGSREEALQNAHTVFGFVVEGMSVVDSIASTQTDASDRPLNPVIVESAYIVYE